ncbi:MAG: type II secretion system protein [Sedimentisphaerales bacterium]|nr:type II secretion system protein [Sedimentisphaerales bacterium]
MKRAKGRYSRRAFTLVEMLVVMGVIAILTSILMPCLSAAKDRAFDLTNRCNQRDIATFLNIYAYDHHDKYPPSVANTARRNANWDWLEPMTMITYYAGQPLHCRSMRDYLGDYIENTDIMVCPRAPSKHKYLQEAWQSKNWDNPDTRRKPDPFFGTYCFYWGYQGYLVNEGRYFFGPRNMAGKRGESTILVSDYFGAYHWKSQNKDLKINSQNSIYFKHFGSCEPMDHAGVTSENDWYSQWYEFGCTDDIAIDEIDIKINVAYTDTHVENYSSSELTTMRVIYSSYTNQWYGEGSGPGDIYIPFAGVY